MFKSYRGVPKPDHNIDSCYGLAVAKSSDLYKCFKKTEDYLSGWDDSEYFIVYEESSVVCVSGKERSNIG